MASVTDLYSSLQGGVGQKTSKARGDYAGAIREQRYVSGPIETKYSNFDC